VLCSWTHHILDGAEGICYRQILCGLLAIKGGPFQPEVGLFGNSRLVKRSARGRQYHNTIRSTIRDKSHIRAPVHSIVAEIANAMTRAGHSGRRGISSATEPVSSAWLRSRTVMSMAILAWPDENADRYDLKASRSCSKRRLFRIAETVLSHKIYQNEIVIRLGDHLSEGTLMRFIHGVAVGSHPYQVWTHA